jgi:hypothetical protein
MIHRIVHCFSARLYGLRNCRKKLNAALAEDIRKVILGHTIARGPMLDQASHFRRACGTKRYAFNWGLAEWQRRTRRLYGYAQACQQAPWMNREPKQCYRLSTFEKADSR